MEPSLVGQSASISQAVAYPFEKGRASSTVAVLSGMGLGWMIGAVVTLLKTAFPFEQPTAPLLLAGCLLAVSVGPGLPQRMIWLLSRSSSRSTPVSLQTHPPRDVQLLWVILAAVSTLAGLAAAAIPLSCIAGRAVYGSAMEHFFWMPLPHGILIVLLTSLMTILPLSLTACGMTCISQLTRSDGLWSQAALPWILLGAGTGLAVSSGLAHSFLPPYASIALAALPLFAVAIVAVGRTKSDTDLTLARETPAPPTPASITTSKASRNIAILTASLQAMAVVAWIRLLATVEQVQLSTASLTTLALWTTAAGIAVAYQRSPTQPFGRLPSVVAVLTGACHLLAAAAVTGGLDSVVGDVGAPDHLSFTIFLIPAIALFAGGWTIGLMHAIALSPTNHGPACSVGRNAAGAAILRRLAAWPAVAIIFTAGTNSVITGPGILLALAGLAIAVGGIVLVRMRRPY